MPFKSKAQMRKCFASHDPKWNCKEWAHATPSIKKLPERISNIPKAKRSRKGFYT